MLGSAHLTGAVEVPFLPSLTETGHEYAGWDAVAHGPAAPTTTVPSAPVEADLAELAQRLVDDGAAPAEANASVPSTAPAEPEVSTPPESSVTTPSTTAPAADPGPGADLALACGGCDVFYVDNMHPNASDGNAGTSQNAPWRTVVHGAAQARAGDTIYVKAGTYDDGWVEITRSGTAAQPIVLAAYPGDEREAVIVNAGIRATGRSHIEIRDFKIMHSPAQGIRVEGPPNASDPPATGIKIIGNHTHDTCSSGISVWGIDWGEDPGDYDNIRNVEVAHNLLELGTNGCKNEIITVANGAVNVDVHHNVIRYGDPNMTGGDEGIDFKEGVRDSRIRNNLIYDLSDKAIYIDGGSGPEDPLVTNIEISGNVMHDLPSHGISIVTEGRGDVDGIWVFNNVVHSVDGDGLIVYDHPGGNADGGTVRNVHFVNNTIVDSGRRHEGHGGIRVNHPTATGIVIRNNITWNNNGYDIRGESETTIDHNLCRETFCETNADPRFRNGAVHDYRLTATSPAIDLGSHDLAPATDQRGVVRPTNQPQDAGAFDASHLSAELPRIVPGGAVLAEGDSGTSVLQVPVTLTKPATAEVTASWYVYGWHADLGNDVIADSGTIRFAPGQTETTISVSIKGDTAPEDDEWFLVPIHDPDGAEMGGFYGLGFGVIGNDD